MEYSSRWIWIFQNSLASIYCENLNEIKFLKTFHSFWSKEKENPFWNVSDSKFKTLVLRSFSVFCFCDIWIRKEKKFKACSWYFLEIWHKANMWIVWISSCFVCLYPRVSMALNICQRLTPAWQFQIC